jgi:hypothetical protein
MVGASYRFRIKPGMTEVGLNPDVESKDVGWAAIGVNCGTCQFYSSLD